MKFLRVNKKRKCVICGHDNWCGISDDGNVAICMRVESEKTAKNNGWIHLLNTEAPQIAAPKISPVKEIVSPDITRTPEGISAVYTECLSHLELTKQHEADLNRRGLSMVARHLHGYKSMPTYNFASAICRRMVAGGFDFRGVPGFYTRGGEWHLVDYRNATGFLIPIRDRRHRIVALQLRRDDKQKPKYLMMSSGWQQNGTNSGTPAHFATLGKIYRREDIKSVIVTEGALKANIAAELSDTPVVGLVSVTTFNDSFPASLREAFPGLEKVQIAFDMDAATNPAVAAQRKRLGLTLFKSDLKATILTWKREFKGLDDYLFFITGKQTSSGIN